MYLFNVYNDMRELNLEFVLAETLRLKKKIYITLTLILQHVLKVCYQLANRLIDNCSVIQMSCLCFFHLSEFQAHACKYSENTGLKFTGIGMKSLG